MTVLASLTNNVPGCGQPQTAHLVAKISKVKDIALILLTSVFSRSSLHLLSESILSDCFATVLCHNCLMRCWSSVANSAAVAELSLVSFLHCCWQRIFNENTNDFQMCKLSIPSAILSEICIKIGWHFCRL